jgi:hypothetical protein
MAVIPAVFAYTKNNDLLISWSAVTEADTCARFPVKEAADEISVHFAGTFGGATISFTGANHDAVGVPMTSMGSGATLNAIASEAMHSILERPLFVTPTLTGGTSTSIDIYMVIRNQNRK